MKNILIIFLTIIIILGIGTGILWLLLKYVDSDNSNPFNSSAFSTISSFDECIMAGYPLAENYPPTCRTDSGKIFTQDIGNQLEKFDIIRVTTPVPNQEISSPLIIEGQARGSWFFEGVFPILLYDENNDILGTTSAQAQSSWSTSEFVPFKATLEFSNLKTAGGNLSLEKNNPSELLENEDQLRIQIQFSQNNESSSI